MDKLDIDLFIFDDHKKRMASDKENKGSIYAALNLFTLSYFEEFFIEHTRDIRFWCDGIVGKMHLQNRGIRTKKLPGPQFLKRILNKMKKDIILLGNMDKVEYEYLSKRKNNVICNYKLVNYKFKDLENLKIQKNTDIIITLPAPFQEEAAFYLHKKFPNNNFFCIGGALKMLAYPELESPKIIRSFGLEWLYRFRTDPKRRLIRILKSLFKYFKNINKISKYQWGLLIE